MISCVYVNNRRFDVYMEMILEVSIIWFYFEIPCILGKKAESNLPRIICDVWNKNNENSLALLGIFSFALFQNDTNCWMTLHGMEWIECTMNQYDLQQTAGAYATGAGGGGGGAEQGTVDTDGAQPTNKF